jgi:hypothetical protein
MESEVFFRELAATLLGHEEKILGLEETLQKAQGKICKSRAMICGP